MQIEEDVMGLKQAGKIANDRLKVHLKKYSYAPVPCTPMMWKYETRPTIFILVVDDFGIKYGSLQDTTYLVNAFKYVNEITVDRTGKIYCGLTLDWDYYNKTCLISIPGYLKWVLYRFQHPLSDKAQ